MPLLMGDHDGANEVPGSTGIGMGQIGELEEDNISCTVTFYDSRSLHCVIVTLVAGARAYKS